MQREQQVMALLLGRQRPSWDQLQKDAHSEALDQQEQQVPKVPKEQKEQKVQGELLPKPEEGRIYGLSGLGLPKVYS